VDENAREAFNKLKQTLAFDEVMLAYPDYSKEFQLTTDPSDYAIGAVLAQEDKPKMFISRTLSKAEESYSPNKKEMLAVIWSIQPLRNVLYGPTKIKIFTDQESLTHTTNPKSRNDQMKRWKAILEEYNHELLHTPGKANVVADALSRPPLQTHGELNDMTEAVHSSFSSPEKLIPMAEEPINVFKNQILLSLGNKSYILDIGFPTYHRHTITEPILNSDNILQILKERLNRPS